MKKKRRPHKWPPEVVEMLYSNWGIRTPADVAKILSHHTGKRYTRGAVLQKACQEGLTAESAQPMMSMADAAREIGINYQTMRYHCKRHGLAVLDRGSVFYLTDETWRAVQAYYAPPPVPTVGAAEAARRMCYSLPAIHVMCQRGTIPFYRQGGRLRIPVAEVERRERLNAGARLIGDAPDTRGRAS